MQIDCQLTAHYACATCLGVAAYHLGSHTFLPTPESTPRACFLRACPRAVHSAAGTAAARHQERPTQSCAARGRGLEVGSRRCPAVRLSLARSRLSARAALRRRGGSRACAPMERRNSAIRRRPGCRWLGSRSATRQVRGHQLWCTACSTCMQASDLICFPEASF